MTHPDQQHILLNQIVNHISEQGTDGLGEAVRLLLNHAMEIERSKALGAEPYERTAARTGYANGFKPKTLQTRLGEMTVAVPQVRGEIGFYPSALERGLRSERALTLAIAQMYVQGVSTRKVTSILEQLAGTLEISSTQVSRAAAQLDVQLEAWRNRRLDTVAYPYLIIDARYEKVRRDGVVLDAAVLVAIGIDENGRRAVLGVSFLRAFKTAASMAFSSSSATITRGCAPRCGRALPACPGNAASSIFNRTRWPTCPRSPSAARWPLNCERCSMRPPAPKPMPCSGPW
jgi:transposase-like protein